MSIKLLDENVLIKPDTDTNISLSGLLLPESVHEKEQMKRGRIVSVGLGRRTKRGGEYIGMDVYPDDEVIYNAHTSTDIVRDGENLSIVRESNIYLVTKGSPYRLEDVILNELSFDDKTIPYWEYVFNIEESDDGSVLIVDVSIYIYDPTNKLLRSIRKKFDVKETLDTDERRIIVNPSQAIIDEALFCGYDIKDFSITIYDNVLITSNN